MSAQEVHMGHPPTQDGVVKQRAEAETKVTIRIGEREYDATPPYTNRELHLIKQISGVRAGELLDAFSAEDNDLAVALAHIAVRRKGEQRPTLDELWDMAVGDVTLEASADESDPTPPADEADGGSQETTPA